MIRDVTQEHFERDVLTRSREVPVVVDFWASWCAPCRALGPTLEREVTALGGRVELAKVDVDQAQALAGRFGVQGIPAVMAFRDGAVVANFVGAKDAAFVRGWLAQLTPSAAASRLAAATSVAELEALVDDPEVGAKAALALAEAALATQDVALALRWLERIGPRDPQAQAAAPLRQRAELALEASRFGGESVARARLEVAPNDLDARFALGAALASRGETEGALEAFLAVVTLRRNYRNDAARLAMLALFEQLGTTHPLTRDFRRRLQIVL